MLVYGIKFKMTDLVMMKFGAEHTLNKYLGVSAPGEAAPDIKRSFLRFRANEEKENLHSFGLEFGVDKPHQYEKIK